MDLFRKIFEKRKLVRNIYGYKYVVCVCKPRSVNIYSVNLNIAYCLCNYYLFFFLNKSLFQSTIDFRLHISGGMNVGF